MDRNRNANVLHFCDKNNPQNITRMHNVYIKIKHFLGPEKRKHEA